MISTRYYMRVDFKPKGNLKRGTTEICTDEISAIMNKYAVHDVMQFYGNLACYPYVDCWAYRYEYVEALEKELTEYLTDHGWEVADD